MLTPITQTEERNNAMKARVEHLKEGVDFNDRRDALKKVFLVTLFLLFFLLNIILVILIRFIGTCIAAEAMEFCVSELQRALSFSDTHWSQKTPDV